MWNITENTYYIAELITNNSLTIFHIERDMETRDYNYTKYEYPKVWIYKQDSASIKEGVNDANSITVRIPYEFNDIDINKISLGDIMIEGILENDSVSINDLSGYKTYTINSVTNNNYGTRQHVHIRGI